ncbi:hypothetical protein [Variovorax sp. WDL1]|uniref:hypothetical protein n=2 Tax=Variovorax TaxID=34072 RepID=UPI00076D3233|nr:hypothetical protein [Variovorax sp. WDL1]KWT64046.1 hypothetical protein APY03_7745 [Variovorax sp. WDL1]
MAQAGQSFTPRQFHRDANIEDYIPAPMRADEPDAFDFQNEPPSRPSLHDAFGIPSQKLDAAHNAIEPQFERFYQGAVNRELSKRDKSSYVEKTRTVKSADGSEWDEKVWERREEKPSVRLQAWQAEKGRKIQTGLNKVDRIMRETAGCPRKTGSNYATDKAKDDLLTSGKQTLNDKTVAGVAVASALNKGPATYAANEDPGLAADLSPMTDGLAAATLAPALAEGIYGAAALLGLRSEQEKAKQALNLKNDARRFLKLQAEATPEEAENYLKFMAAGGKLFEPTLEDAATTRAAVDRVARTGVLSPLQGSGAAALEIANTMTSFTPWANAAFAPIAVAGGGVRIHEGRQELLRRVGQQVLAEGRKARMKAMLEEFKNHPEFKAHPERRQLFEGVVKCLDAQQDRLIRQAAREKIYARGRIFDGGGAIGGALGGLAALGTLAGLGALTAATGGAAGLVPVLGAAAWGTAVAVRNGQRAGAEHTSKWRQRAVRVLGFEMSREELEHKVAGTHLDGSNVEVHIQEGDYLPEMQSFRGRREMKFDALENEYLGLHVLALQVQDIVKDHDCNRASPYVRLLEAFDIDAIKLLAICKAASAKPANTQLDFIKSHLAPALRLKLRTEGGVQAVPHVSVFLRHFEIARSKALGKVETITSKFGYHIRKELEAYYPDPIAGLAAFDKAVGAFLKADATRPSETDMSARIFMGQLEDVVKAGELDDPIRQLEQFRWPGAPDSVVTA